MSTRAVVNVATGQYVKGQGRLRLSEHVAGATLKMYIDCMPHACPPHSSIPYGFKAYGLKEAAVNYDLLLWCDASILPIRSLEPLWERIERDGYWFSKNGWTNYEWTADSAYKDLFYPTAWASDEPKLLEDARHENRRIQHVVATAFGLNVRHPKGRAFLDEYYRLASETRAFCGPWTNCATHPNSNHTPTPRCEPCGPPDVRGHRHDQTAASVIAWRLGFELTSPPDIFAYANADGSADERTILVADGSY